VTETVGFTAEQLALIEATQSTYVEACPGAGKTQSIIERFIRRANGDPRRGVALISFTNAVVEEARARCTGRLDLARSPNFVGTIDSFINHFIVRPLLTSEAGRTLTFRSSWERIPGSLITANGVPAQALLDWFTFTLDGAATLHPRRVPADRAAMIRGLQAWQISRLEHAASRQWRQNIERGVVDAAASRLYLVRYLRETTTHTYLVELMSSRFCEVIVDEVQDCSAEDVTLLQLLVDSGLRLILVGDPEQAIYSFRGGSASQLAAVLDTVGRGPRLDGNFRSSAAICSAVDSLRSSPFTDRAVGINKDVLDPVRLVRYHRPGDARSQIRAVLAEHGISTEDVVVLAHAGAKARACAGAGSSTGTPSGSRFVALANFVDTIQDEDAPARARADALSALEAALHQLTPEGLRALAMEQYLEQVGLSARGYRAQCLRLAVSLPSPYVAEPSVFKAALVDSTEAQRMMRWGTTGLRQPAGNRWPSRPSRTADSDQHSTIHGYKGLQSVAVALIIPERLAGIPESEDGLSQWTTGTPGEARNVMYVGASRAERLLIIVAHESVFDEVRRNLERDGVTYSEHPS
jgi:ATP-dependent DNA helicase UvrD/PcrA